MRRLLLMLAKPIVTEGTAPGAIGNLLLVPLALLMLGISLRREKDDQTKLAIR